MSARRLDLFLQKMSEADRILFWEIKAKHGTAVIVRDKKTGRIYPIPPQQLGERTPAFLWIDEAAKIPDNISDILTLHKIHEAVEMCQAHDRQQRARALAYDWWPYDLAFSQMEVMEQGGRDLTDLFEVYGGPRIRELYKQWKIERHRL